MEIPCEKEIVSREQQVDYVRKLSNEYAQLHKEYNNIISNAEFYKSDSQASKTAQQRLDMASQKVLPSKLEAKIKHLNELLASANEGTKQMQATLIRSVRRENRGPAEIDSFETIINQLHVKIESLEKENKNFEAKIIEFEAKIIIQKNSYLKEKDELEAIIASQKETIDAIEISNARLYATEEDFQTTHNRLTQENQKIKEQIKAKPNQIMWASGGWLLGILMCFLYFNR
jgi:chromosome segregation ATPase